MAQYIQGFWILRKYIYEKTISNYEFNLDSTINV